MDTGQGPWSVWTRMAKDGKFIRRDTYKDFEIACEFANEWMQPHLKAKETVVRDVAYITRYTGKK
jgi:hypothetical protein